LCFLRKLQWNVWFLNWFRKTNTWRKNTFFLLSLQYFSFLFFDFQLAFWSLTYSMEDLLALSSVLMLIFCWNWVIHKKHIKINKKNNHLKNLNIYANNVVGAEFADGQIVESIVINLVHDVNELDDIFVVDFSGTAHFEVEVDAASLITKSSFEESCFVLTDGLVVDVELEYLRNMYNDFLSLI